MTSTTVPLTTQEVKPNYRITRGDELIANVKNLASDLRRGQVDDLGKVMAWADTTIANDETELEDAPALEGGAVAEYLESANRVMQETIKAQQRQIADLQAEVARLVKKNERLGVEALAASFTRRDVTRRDVLREVCRNLTDLYVDHDGDRCSLWELLTSGETARINAAAEEIDLHITLGKVAKSAYRSGRIEDGE